MSRAKPIALVKGHRTKKEIEHRKKEEKLLVTGIALKEWPEVKNSPVAHKEFTRIKKLLSAINKDDGLCESVLNRYCLVHAECIGCQELKVKLYLKIENLANEDMTATQKAKMENSILDKIFQLDKILMAKRKMLLDIEKENLLTINSSMRAVPKKPVEEEDEDPMAIYLRGGKP